MNMQMFQDVPPFHIITGHYGSGKTNYALNLAIELKKLYEKVCIIDLDIVNPYFRTADFSDMLVQKGIEVLKPNYAGTNVDIPSISQAIHSVFLREDTYIVADIGGDDAGAMVLGSIQANLQDKPYRMYYIANRYRYLTRKAAQAYKILKEIESVSRLKANAIVNNSNLGELTKWETVEQTEKYGQEIAARANVPVIQTIPSFLKKKSKFNLENKQFIEVYSTKNWT